MGRIFGLLEVANLINQEVLNRFLEVEHHHKYCDTALTERKNEIIELCKYHSIAFGKCLLLEKHLWRLCDEINSLIGKTDELLKSDVLENCESNAYACIDIINKTIVNTESQLDLVRTVRDEPGNESVLEHMNEYEIRLEHDKEALKLFKRSVLKFTDHI